MWKPFDVRFGDIMDRMRHHRELISSELNIIAAQAANNAEAVAAEERLLAAKERSRADASRKHIEEWSRRFEKGENGEL
jgi:hypothetical protein